MTEEEEITLTRALVAWQRGHAYQPSMAELGDRLGLNKATISRQIDAAFGIANFVTTKSGLMAPRTIHVTPGIERTIQLTPTGLTLSKFSAVGMFAYVGPRGLILTLEEAIALRDALTKLLSG